MRKKRVISCCVIEMALSDYGVVVDDDDPNNMFMLERAVCNHGFFMMAPNHWDPNTKTFTRPLRLTNNNSFTVSISQPLSQIQFLLLQVHGVNVLPPKEVLFIKAQVARMLRLSNADENDIQEFHILHPEARNKGFGRLFRSPTLFEDIVKSFLLCNCNWKRSLDMAEALCELQYKVGRGRIKKNGRVPKRKRSRDNRSESCVSIGNFPSPEELSLLSVDELNEFCNLGYRGANILQLAGHIVSGKIELQSFNKNSPSSAEETKRLLEKIKGVSEFTSANIMMCIGSYHFVPCDTETVRHLRQVHKIQDCSKKNVASIATKLYDPYSPYRYLAYWYELIEGYQTQLGKSLSELTKSEYALVTAVRN